MTNEDKSKIMSALVSGMSMLVDKLETVGRSKSEWTMGEMGCLADIMKDISETYKNIAKTHYLYSEHSDERY